MISALFSILDSLISFLLNLLPDSFIASALEEAAPDIEAIMNVVGYINYFIPLDTMSVIFSVWSVSMLTLWVYYSIKNRI